MNTNLKNLLIVNAISVTVILVVSGTLWALQTKQNRQSISQGELIPFVTLAEGNSSNVWKELFLVIKTQSEWEQFVRENELSGMPMSSSVDFSKEMIIGVFGGMMTVYRAAPHRDGPFIEITRVGKREGKLIVRFLKNPPRQSDGPPVEFTTPFHLIKVEHTAFPVEFEAIQE